MKSKMKKLVSLMLVMLLVLAGINVYAVPNAAAEKRAVWISTVYNLDYSSTKNNIEAQKNEFYDKLSQLKSIGINTVIVQVRPKADALYKSSINPWSDILTGTQGKDPGYDPLAFMVSAAHEKGMAIEAWLNPYRVTTSGTNVNALNSLHPARLNPSWVFAYNNALYYNPEVEGVKQHIVDTVTEIGSNYDVDGIHFDDYFYPSSYPLPSGEGKDGVVANTRRHHINDMISRVHTAIANVNKAYAKNITFGVSPAGIWKNSTTDSTGSATNGNQSYYSVYADTRTWIQNGWIDYVAPQIYWETGHKLADYETLVKWWSNEVAGTNVKLYIGQGIYRDAVATQIDTQLGINKNYSQVKGSIFFSLRDLLNNRGNCKTKIASFYQNNPVSSVVTGTTSNVGNTTTNTPASNISSNTVAVSNTNHIVKDAAGKTGIVTATILNIRSGAKIDREIVAKATLGTKLTIKAVLNNWYKVQLTDGTIGWASAPYIKVETSNETTTTTNNTNSAAVQTTKKGTVTATTLNLRQEGNATSQIVAFLKQGDKVTITVKQGNWYKVKTQNGTVGFVSASYIKED
ncbi:family 10 glycosylhydrolase [Cellulosilyticum ruminicola]|uniref:family 10 glycosylhydrolase n=1 Tax=Cellulosilyticum ruminicola TaxID=425254 RepID=UPI0006D1A1BE|nr:family 10 glycosylhydrolase [Cellulosilyticum ruminicola]